MKPPIFKIFFALLLGWLLLVILLMLQPAPAGMTGTLHPTYQTMFSSGAVVLPDGPFQILSYLFGVFVIFVFTACLIVGTLRAGQWGRMHRWILAFGALYLSIYTMLVIAWWRYAEYGLEGIFGGFPIPTAWMIYGIWFSPFLLTILYISFFHKWTLTDADMAVFRSLVEQNRQQES